MTRFFFPDPHELAKTGHDGIASVPVLFDRGYRILPAENHYLLDRALSAWPIRERDTYRPKDDSLAHTTVVAIARRLHHFSDWRHGLAVRSTNPLDDLTYDDVLAYERAQWLGQGAFEGRSVSRATASVRADVATDFLLWAAHRGLRIPFSMVKHSFAPSRAGGSKGRPRSADTMKGLSQIPDRTEIKVWLDAVGKQRGLPKYLICRTMCETGIRLMEAVALEVDQWPSTVDVEKAQFAGRTAMDLVLTVTKNSKIRTVKVPMPLARTVAWWVRTSDKGGRRALQDLCVARRGEEWRSKRLFISDRPDNEGIPIQRHTVFDCFREVEPRPAGWHPHKARHAFACHFMMRELRTHAGSTKSGVEKWIEQGGVVAAENLRRLLGHESLETTRIYLNYLRLNASVAMIYEKFHDLINGENDGSSSRP